MQPMETDRLRADDTSEDTHVMYSDEDQDIPQPAEQAANTLFFARCPPTLPYEELMELFNVYGEIKELNLYRRWAKAKNSKGCGTVLYKDKACAKAAMDALNGKQEWPESEAKMVVEWCVPEKLQVKPKSSGNNTTGIKSAFKPKSAAKGSKSLPLPKPVCAGDLDASQRLFQDAWTHSLMNLHLNDYSSGSDLDSPVPAHLVPMMANMQLVNLPAVTQTSSNPGLGVVHPIRHLAGNWGTAPNTLLHTTVPAAKDFLDQDDVEAALSTLQNNCSGSCNIGLAGRWSRNSKPDRQRGSSDAAAAAAWSASALSMLPDADHVWQRQAALAAGAAANSMASCLTNSNTSLSGVASHSMPCSAVFDTNTPLCSPANVGHGSGGLFCSAEHAFGSLSSSGAFAGLEACSSLQQSSGALPNLLEVIPAMSWLQLQMDKQQLQQQHAMMNASCTTPVASSPFPTVPEQYFAMTTGNVPTTAAAAAAVEAAPKLQEARVDLNPQSLNVIVASINDVAKVSDANITIDASREALQLRVTGSAAQVEAACNCLRYILSTGAI